MATRLPLLQNFRFWTVCFLVWFIVLNLLSHGNRFHPPGTFIFDIPHFDKIVHFGYFFGGSGLLSAALFLSKKKNQLGSSSPSPLLSSLRSSGFGMNSTNLSSKIAPGMILPTGSPMFWALSLALSSSAVFTDCYFHQTS